MLQTKVIKNIFNKILGKNSGQSTIEFLFSFIIILGIMVIIIKLAINLSFGYLAHYATYRASRAYLVFENNSNDPGGGDNLAFAEAKKEFDKYQLPAYFGSANLVQFSPTAGGGRNLQFVGVVSDFNTKMTAGSIIGGNRTLDWKSEAFLGREPTRATCAKNICEAFGDVSGAGCGGHMTRYDNGC